MLIKEKLLKLVKFYYENKNFNIVGYRESLNIHDELAEIKYKILPKKES